MRTLFWRQLLIAGLRTEIGPLILSSFIKPTSNSRPNVTPLTICSRLDRTEKNTSRTFSLDTFPHAGSISRPGAEHSWFDLQYWEEQAEGVCFIRAGSAHLTFEINMKRVNDFIQSFIATFKALKFFGVDQVTPYALRKFRLGIGRTQRQHTKLFVSAFKQ